MLSLSLSLSDYIYMLPVLGIYRKSLQQTVFGSYFLWNKRTRHVFLSKVSANTNSDTTNYKFDGDDDDVMQVVMVVVVAGTSPRHRFDMSLSASLRPRQLAWCGKEGTSHVGRTPAIARMDSKLSECWHQSPTFITKFFWGVYNPETNSVASESYHPAHILIRTTQKPPGSCELGMFTEIWFVHQQEAPSLSGSILFAVDPAILGMVTLQRHFNGHSWRCISHPSFQPHGLSY